jgi:hypothetical protein
MVSSSFYVVKLKITFLIPPYLPLAKGGEDNSPFFKGG